MVFCCNCPLCIGVSVLSLHRCPALYSEFGTFMLTYACWRVLSLLCVVGHMCAGMSRAGVHTCDVQLDLEVHVLRCWKVVSVSEALEVFLELLCGCGHG